RLEPHRRPPELRASLRRSPALDKLLRRALDRYLSALGPLPRAVDGYLSALGPLPRAVNRHLSGPRPRPGAVAAFLGQRDQDRACPLEQLVGRHRADEETVRDAGHPRL